jgi:hypothetical protein
VTNEPRRTELSSDPGDYLTGPVQGSAKSNGGTTRDGGVAAFGASREDTAGGEVGGGDTTQQQPDAGATSKG